MLTGPLVLVEDPWINDQASYVLLPPLLEA